jgi:hypothetical protein
LKKAEKDSSGVISHVKLNLALAFLAIVFTLALAFATLELPIIVNGLLASYFADVPTDVSRGGREPEGLEAFMAYAREF